MPLTNAATAKALSIRESRRLRDLQGIGPAMLRDFEQLGIVSVEQLALQDSEDLYEKLNQMTGTRQDPCVLDTFHCAIAQARNPRLPKAQRNWWYWSRRRKSSRPLAALVHW